MSDASHEPGLCSVVVPAFQGDRLVGEALESVQAQHHPDWELLVVEDGSRDRTEAIVRDFAHRCPGHRVVFERHGSNKGVSAARNTAIRLARGDSVALLDYDDVWRPEHLTRSLAALREKDADLAFCDVTFLEDETGAVEDPEASSFGGDWLRQLFFGNFIANSSVVLRRAALERVGLFDPDPAIQFCEDYDLWLRFAMLGMRFVKATGRTVLYRRHSAQATARIGMMREREWLVVRRRLRDFPLARRDIRRRAAEINLRNGMWFWSSNPPLARKYLWRSACYDPGSARRWWLALKRTLLPSAKF